MLISIFYIIYQESICIIDILLDFIKDLGKITNKEIILTPESSREIIILKYEPQNNVFTYL